jgi:hypothetical protein
MHDKQALNVLLALRDKKCLTAEEREAISTAIGILSWTSLSEGRIKRMKKSREAKRETVY